MTLFKAIRVEINSEATVRVEADHQVEYIIANTVESPTIKEIVQLLARNAKSVDRTVTLRLSVKVVNVTPVPVDISQRKQKAKDFMK